MNYIIGIAGAKNSGKDTIANIISYIDDVGLSKATYRGWLVKSNVKYNNIIHFADALKELVSKIFRIKLDYFYHSRRKRNSRLDMHCRHKSTSSCRCNSHRF